MKTELSRERILEELSRILDSGSFDASKRNRLFLQYAVEETLEGRADRIKAYSVATTVFGRDERFDPQSDSIVRIEAGRLRRSLERYYLTAGVEDPVRIEIPRGSYIPTFEPVEPPAPTLVPSPTMKRTGRGRAGGTGPAIFVTPFEAEDDQSALPYFTRGFTRQVIVALTRFTELFVFGPETSFSYASGVHRADILADLDVDFILTGGTTLGEHRFEVDALLLEVRTGRYVWAESFARDMRPPDIVIARGEIANSIARILAQPYGVIFRQADKYSGATIPEDLTSYDLMVQSYDYRRAFDRDRFEPIRAGLEQVILKEPRCAEAVACLSMMYADACRFRHDVSAVAVDPGERAFVLARHAIELAPESSRAHHALALAYWNRGDVAGALGALAISLAYNPNDTEVMAELGLRHAMLGDCERAIPLLKASFDRNVAQPSVYRMGMFFVQLASGNPEEAFAEAKRIDAPQFAHGHAAAAVAAAHAGLRAEAKSALRAVLEVEPDYADHVVEDLHVHHIHPELARLWLEGLRKAGLPLPTDTPRSALRAV